MGKKGKKDKGQYVPPGAFSALSDRVSGLKANLDDLVQRVMFLTNNLTKRVEALQRTVDPLDVPAIQERFSEYARGLDHVERLHVDMAEAHARHILDLKAQIDSLLNDRSLAPETVITNDFIQRTTDRIMEYARGEINNAMKSASEQHARYIEGTWDEARNIASELSELRRQMGEIDQRFREWGGDQDGHNYRLGEETHGLQRQIDEMKHTWDDYRRAVNGDIRRISEETTNQLRSMNQLVRDSEAPPSAVSRTVDERIKDALATISPSFTSDGDTIIDELKSKCSYLHELVMEHREWIDQLFEGLKNAVNTDYVNQAVKRIRADFSLMMEDWQSELDVLKGRLERQIIECASGRAITGDRNVTREQIDSLRWDGPKGDFGKVIQDIHDNAKQVLSTNPNWEDTLGPEEPEEVPLQDDTNAMRWAEEFAAMIERKKSELGVGPTWASDMVCDTGFMVGWFANAIGAGRRAGWVEGTNAQTEMIFSAQLSDKDRAINTLEGLLKFAMKLLDDAAKREGGPNVVGWVRALDQLNEQYATGWLGG